MNNAPKSIGITNTQTPGRDRNIKGKTREEYLPCSCYTTAQPCRTRLLHFRRPCFPSFISIRSVSHRNSTVSQSLHLNNDQIHTHHRNPTPTPVRAGTRVPSPGIHHARSEPSRRCPSRRHCSPCQRTCRRRARGRRRRPGRGGVLRVRARRIRWRARGVKGRACRQIRARGGPM